MGTPNIKGTFTTIRWGTSGVLQGALANAAIVKSIRISRLGGEPTKIEDNDGFTAIVVGINDGDRVEFTVVDDVSKSWPAFMDTFQLLMPGDAEPKYFLCLDSDPNMERKREGERVIIAEYYVNNFLS